MVAWRYSPLLSLASLRLVVALVAVDRLSMLGRSVVGHSAPLQLHPFGVAFDVGAASLCCRL